MTDVVLVPITGAANLSAINNNFAKVQTSINSDVLNLAGGNNVMNQDLDMNGNSLLNHATDPSNPNSLLSVGEGDSRYYNVSGDTLSGPMNVGGQQVSGLPIPASSSSPVRKQEFDAYIAVQDVRDDAQESLISSNELQSVRGPEGEVLATLPPSASRANKAIGFDSNGNPTAILPASGSATELALDLANFSDVTRGSALVGFKRATLADTILTVSQMLSAQEINVWEKAHLITSKPVANNPSTWDWSPALNAALVLGSVYCPGPWTYHVQDIRLYDGREVVSDKSATFVPTANNVTMFYCNDEVVGARNFSLDNIVIKNPESKTGVTAIYFPQARRNIQVNRVSINGGGRALGWLGVHWPKLNWVTNIHQVLVEACDTGFRCSNAAAVMDLSACVAIDCAVGFDFAFTGGDVDIMNRNRICMGVCQSNGTGIRTRNTDGIVIDYVHFEQNTIDIDCDGDRNIFINNVELRGNNTGLTSTGIKMRNVLGATINKPILAGVRQAGWFDIDSTNTLCMLDMDLRLDAPLINSVYTTNTGNVSGVQFVYKHSQVRSLGSTVIDATLPLSSYQRTVPNGGETITATNAIDGREVRIILRPSSGYTSGAVTVLGRSLDVSGGAAIASKNKTLQFQYRTAAGGWVLVSETAGWV